MTTNELQGRIRDEIRRERQGGVTVQNVRLHPEQLKLLAGNYGIDHREDGSMFILDVALVPDDSVEFGKYEVTFGPWSQPD